MDDRYPYFLVTRGQSPKTQTHPDRLLPLALVTKKKGLQEVARAVEDRLRKIALAFTPHAPSAIDVIKGVSHFWMAKALQDLWLSEVRLDHIEALDSSGEESIRWILLGDPCDRLPERWQGPADAVIPKDTPVTIRDGTLSRFEVEVTA